MIDIHSHLLPGVDDGSPSLDVSIPVLQRFAAQGVTVLVCTPHLNASQAASAPYARHGELLALLRAAAPADLDIRLGWEIMLDSPGVELTAPELCLGNSRALLVEFTRGGLPRGATSELRRIARSGRTPILAHPERYFGCTLELVRQWRALGVVIQTDASVLMGRGVPADLAKAMLADGLIDILASDNHGDGRSLGTARDWLAERGADEQSDLLLRANAERVLGDEDPLPVPPLRDGLVGRIKRILGR
ncbi:CpsB/CapC family capsule biosynthesis tyrosine phosphatase [Gemmatimonas sp.]|uniref:CpsB/CapC family capsule biosynthesis tyrosine phosphatase n=1 Tax=Gemmatimonas sp. TaxID=1962908 RepID=UPI00286EA59F|nr:CpsB/CapC family capsule biosynthesis tyrosine phosphatase [Gemmatimonas sp.]